MCVCACAYIRMHTCVWMNEVIKMDNVIKNMEFRITRFVVKAHFHFSATASSNKEYDLGKVI